LCDLVWNNFADGHVSDAALMARKLYQLSRADLLAAASEARNGRKLLSNPDLREDVPFCIRQDVFPFAAALQQDGKIVIS